MKYLFLLLLIFPFAASQAQNQISTPTGQSLRIKTDTMFIKGQVRIDSGFIKLANYRFLTLTKGAGNLLNSFIGPNSGNLSMTGRNNTFFGERAGEVNSTGNNNTFMGTFSGMANTTGGNNTFVGYKSGYLTTTGANNVMIGNTAGNGNTTGASNVFLGLDAGYFNSTGQNNVFVGRGASLYNISGQNNTSIGNSAGYNALGSGNVFLGYQAGYNNGAQNNDNNRLHISNSNLVPSLIYGEFATTSPVAEGRLVFNGRVSINSSTFPASADTNNTSGFKLFVNGGLLAKRVVININWADYVFDDNYKLKSLPEVERFINENGHLPNIPSSREVEKSGIDVGDITRLQQEKIEELTLYAIEHDKQINQNGNLIQKQETEIQRLSELLLRLEQQYAEKKK